jgi:CBS domain-containing membrane protein
MKVEDVMTVSLITVLPTTSFRDVWKVIFRQKINALPVVDKKKKLLGIVAKESLLEHLFPDYEDLFSSEEDFPDFEEMEGRFLELDSLSAADIMTKRLISTEADIPVMQALSRMIVRGVNQMPVLAEGGALVGFITKGDIFYNVFKTYMKRKPRKK